MSERSPARTRYSSRGVPTYFIEIRHRELNEYKIIRDSSLSVAEYKAQLQMQKWDDAWAKATAKQQRTRSIEDKKQIAIERTQEAKTALGELENILAHTLGIDDTVDWDSLKNFSDFLEPKPRKPAIPDKPSPSPLPKKPQPTDSRYQVELGLVDKIVSSRGDKKKRAATESFEYDLKTWNEKKAQTEARDLIASKAYEDRVAEIEATHEKAVADWEARRDAYLRQRDEQNAAVDKKRADYQNGEPGAIVEYCDLVLSNSEYPDFCPQSFELDYNPETKVLIADYQLPSPDSLPTLVEVKYVQNRDEFSEKHISQPELNRLYDELIYQIALRTIHELFEADQIDALASIAFNGYVRSIDRAIGREVNACVLSLLVSKPEFLEINLANIEPKACFKKLKGVGSSKLHSVTPVAPILAMEREDKRFVDSYAVVDSIQEGDNLAAMDWEDFEHLIREIFEQEFSQAGGEVKVTRASRDGGVDAVVFDPDPLRGGKIVIQAKRYVNVVGVSAVRDLYGTVMNEGANKGILVTTADYGPDAYEFAKGKPLVLLNGGNLLHLLEKHGHKAHIDLKAAKQILTGGETG